jgi:hypothetical protein
MSFDAVRTLVLIFLSWVAVRWAAQDLSGAGRAVSSPTGLRKILTRSISTSHTTPAFIHTVSALHHLSIETRDAFQTAGTGRKFIRSDERARRIVVYADCALRCPHLIIADRAAVEN